MLATLLLTTFLSAGADEPASELPAVHTVSGPYFRMPCKWKEVPDAECVQVYVSDTRGETWGLWTELTTEKPDFTYRARKAGEYWFAVRIKKKDGTIEPAADTELVPQQRVAVRAGSEPITKTDTLNELDDELTRLEFELIRKELKQLAEETVLSPVVLARIDLLRNRLKAVREKLETEQHGTGKDPLRSGPSVITSRPSPTPVVPAVTPVVPAVLESPSEQIKPPVPPLPTAPKRVGAEPKR